MALPERDALRDLPDDSPPPDPNKLEMDAFYEEHGYWGYDEDEEDRYVYTGGSLNTRQFA